MADKISITFLGTAAGKPCHTRNVSSLALRLDHKLWVVDAGEGTQHQFMKSSLKMSAVRKIFVTHMHGDHVNGLVGLLCTISAGEGSVLPGVSDPRLSASGSLPPTEIFGPKGLRSFLRVNLSLTCSTLTRPYVVHELLFPGEAPSRVDNEEALLHVSEKPDGRDIVITHEISTWVDFLDADGIKVSAGPILHTVPCIGYIFTESPRPLPLDIATLRPLLLTPTNIAALASQGISQPLSLLSTLTRTRQPITLPDGSVLEPPKMGGKGRKIVILGDTYDASGCIPLAKDADLVVHECTNAFLPGLDASQSPGGSGVEDEDEDQDLDSEIVPKKKQPPSKKKPIPTKEKPPVTESSVMATAREHGHSTPQVAGAFARAVGAKMLLLNHLSVKYAHVAEEPPESVEGREGERKRWEMLREIERLTDVAWFGAAEGEGEGRKAVVAFDFLEVEVKRRREQVE